MILITARIKLSSLAVVALVSALLPKPASAQKPTRSQQTMAAVKLHEAVVSAEHGDLPKAYKITQELLSKNPKFEPAQRLQGMILEELGRNAEAADAYQRALMLAPTDSEVSLKLGIMKLVAGDTDQAIKLLGERTKQVPQDGDALY